MTFIDAVILGFVQGITEFIPISSSGHLILTDQFFSAKSSFEYDVLLNFGTLLALLIYFRKKLTLMYINVTKKRDWTLARNILISTIPIAVLGYLFSGVLGKDTFRNTATVALMLLVVGLVMVLEPRFNRVKKIGLEGISTKKAVGIGFAQALALIPGTSRSGATILAGRFAGLSNGKAAEYSFLIAIPALTGALIKTLLEGEAQELINSSGGLLVVGITTAFITGYFAIAVMLKFLRKHSLAVFGYYRIALALLLLLTLV